MPAPPAEPPVMRQKSHPPRQPKAIAKGQLHPRNRHQGRYDFPRLIEASPELGRFVILNPYGKQSIDFADPEAVRVFNRALMRQRRTAAAVSPIARERYAVGTARPITPKTTL